MIDLMESLIRRKPNEVEVLSMLNKEEVIRVPDTSEVVPAPDPAPVSPTGLPVLPQWLVITLTVFVGLAVGVKAIPGLPAFVGVIADVVVGLAGLFGIMSPGVRKTPA